MNTSAANNFDPDCIHCPYQPFCGSDVIDDVSRYGRIDLPRGDTWFCRRQLSIFDRIVALIYSRDEKARFSLRHWAGVASWPDQLAPRHDFAAHQSRDPLGCRSVRCPAPLPPGSSCRLRRRCALWGRRECLGIQTNFGLLRLKDVRVDEVEEDVLLSSPGEGSRIA